MSKLFNKQQFLVVGFALVITMFPFAPTPSWACSAGGGGAFSYGSQTSGGSVTVCARAVVETRSVSAPKAAPKPVVSAPKAAPKPVVSAPKPAPKPVASAPKPAPKPVIVAPKPVTRFFSPPKLTPPPALLKPTPKPVAKVVPKPVIKAPAPVANKPVVIVVSSATDGQASFTPAPVTALADPPNLSPGEATTLTANPMLHYQLGALLGKSTNVRFEPIATVWNFGDGTTGSGSVAAHAYGADGQYQARATVTYAVYYSIAGQTGWEAGGQITVTDLVLVQVSDSGVEMPADPDPVIAVPVVRLVGKNCLAQIGAYGCTV